MTREKNEILVLGLGNDIMGDDASGLIAVRRLQEIYGDTVDIFEVATAGFGLMDILEGYKKVLILDTMLSDTDSHGEVKELSKVNLTKCSTISPHYVGLPELMALAKKLDISFPEEVKILVLEINEHGVIREGLSDDIQKSIPQFVDRAGGILNQWLNPELRYVSDGQSAMV